MPRGDGTGPRGQGSGTGLGKGMGTGGGAQGRSFLGPGGYCVCPNCRNQIPHTPGTPCVEIKCPKCGSNMVRA